LSIIGAKRQGSGIGSAGSAEMGGELAHFKTTQLCSITAFLSNTIAAAINRFSRRRATRRNRREGRRYTR
jgi:hypothetical protein